MTDGASLLRYLGDDWLAAADASLANLSPLEGEVRIGFHVSEGVASTTKTWAHVLVLGPDRVGTERGLDGAAVTLHLDWDVAVSINQGNVSAQRAFLDGRIVLDGDPGVLLGHQAALAAIEDRLSDLRARTAY